MTDSDTTARSVVIWVREGTWRATVDAALSLATSPVRFTLLHVTSPAAADAAHGAYRGLLGRGGHDPGERLEALASASAADLIEAAARSGEPGRAAGALQLLTDLEHWLREGLHPAGVASSLPSRQIRALSRQFCRVAGCQNAIDQQGTTIDP